MFETVQEQAWRLDDRDIEVFTTRDRGAGGQHRNTTDSCVVMRHKPSGIEAKAAAKSQHQNRRVAREILETRVAAFYSSAIRQATEEQRRTMVGSGQRADKIRTYREQDDLVTDHRSGRKARLKEVRAGALHLIR
ncbi:peptide chain release factor-like protein [Cupriavidus sp. TMH.W2]|uniref:peptide chain release factor-like protein n=1 Tax=Cupriavidus sp. TMH.W2 TaxID=3434465 RepID=UPI003D786CD7